MTRVLTLAKGGPRRLYRGIQWRLARYVPLLARFCRMPLALRRMLRRRHVWTKYAEEAEALAYSYDFSHADLATSRAVNANRSRVDIRTVTWFIPDFHHAYYGGIYTVLRFAQYFQEKKGVENRFVIVGSMTEARAADLISRAFPDLVKVPILRIGSWAELERLGDADAAIATLWTTAYAVLKYNVTKRKFYFLQDYEPLFYPAGSTYAQAEATYRFGFYGIANTPTLKHLYTEKYGGVAECFVPCVDTRVFKPSFNSVFDSAPPYEVFFYGRPEHPRNGFELGLAALRKLKERLGNQVRIVSAGAAWRPSDYGVRGIIENLGLLDYQDTAALYRECAVGLVMMFTRHPSYIPLEMMASGSLVVSNYNPATVWLLRHGENCLLSEASASCLAATLEQALLCVEERRRIVANAAREIQTAHADWERQMDMIYRYMCEPVERSVGE